MENAWNGGLREDALAGGCTEEALRLMDTAIVEKDFIQIRLLWDAIKICCETGMANDPAGLQTSKSLRIQLFDEAVKELEGYGL
jgi:hypothetical protein